MLRKNNIFKLVEVYDLQVFSKFDFSKRFGLYIK